MKHVSSNFFLYAFWSVALEKVDGCDKSWKYIRSKKKTLVWGGSFIYLKGDGNPFPNIFSRSKHLTKFINCVCSARRRRSCYICRCLPKTWHVVTADDEGTNLFHSLILGFKTMGLEVNWPIGKQQLFLLWFTNSVSSTVFISSMYNTLYN